MLYTCMYTNLKFNAPHKNPPELDSDPSLLWGTATWVTAAVVLLTQLLAREVNKNRELCILVLGGGVLVGSLHAWENMGMDWRNYSISVTFLRGLIFAVFVGWQSYIQEINSTKCSNCYKVQRLKVWPGSAFGKQLTHEIYSTNAF